MKRYMVIIGNFGSGKTELALNTAFTYANRGQKVTLVDIDVINPYFRATERKEELNKAGVRLISPNFTSSGVEVPSIPAEIFSVFSDNSDLVIFDVGGDPVGAIALGQYYGYFKQIEGVDVYYVINARRPLSCGVEENLELIEKIQGVSRLAVTGLVNNTNLTSETNVQDLLYGASIVSQVSKSTGIPVSATVGTEAVLEDFSNKIGEFGLADTDVGRLIPIERYMHRDWESYTKKGL